jgi:hypothetical protein
MNNPTWRSEDGQLLRSLREEAGIEELVFARHNTVSLAQLKELELGGHSSFYTLAIKRSTGAKLLKKLGHDLVTPELVTVPQESTEPSLNESPSAIATVMAPAPISHPKAPSDSHRRGLIQQALFWTLGVLGLVALTAFKPWGLWDGPATDRRSDPQATLAPSPKVLSAPQTAQSAPVQREFMPSAAPTEETAFTPASAELSRPVVKVSFPTVTSSCDWQHSDKSKTHTPNQPLKPGNYVYLEAQADTELCVLDSQNQKTMLHLKAGMVTSVYGAAPFLLHSQDWQNLKLFFQGRRVMDAQTDVQHLLLDSQPL